MYAEKAFIAFWLTAQKESRLAISEPVVNHQETKTNLPGSPLCRQLIKRKTHSLIQKNNLFNSSIPKLCDDTKKFEFLT